MALVLFFGTKAFTQNTFKARLLDSETKEPLIGATAFLPETSQGAAADREGLVTISDIANGTHPITFAFLGYEERTETFLFPMPDTTIEVLLEPDMEELGEVEISSMRSSRTISDIPTRIEFIGGEELEEKSNMKPDLRMLLSESTGIQTQQTSATSANASIRIQGLDGRYTQILKDGFPLYSGASSGLGLLQTPPLDLKQVEVIKGSTSTLYGGGAIAGLVNLISKTPKEKRDLRFQVNGTSGLGLDVNGFYGQRFGKIGTTVFASYNSNEAYDPAGINLSAIPKFKRYTVNPKLFLYLGEKTNAVLGINASVEDRLGGDMRYIAAETDTVPRYFERNQTQRYSSQLSLTHQLRENGRLYLKNSLSHFQRKIEIPGYAFDGTQQASFSELGYAHTGEKIEWIIGGNVWTDDFKEVPRDTIPLRNYTQTTIGAFVQNTFKASEKISLETGLRVDHVIEYGTVLLPRVSALFKLSQKWTSRLGGGFGYKSPTIFTEESERIQYRNVLPIDPKRNSLEKSYGANWDFNYRAALGENMTFSINHLFFFTYLDNPLLLQPDTSGVFRFTNIPGHIATQGTETNVKFGYKDFKLFLGYTYTDTRIIANGISSENPLTSKHRINSVLMFEQEDKWKIGLEAYYFSQQKLSDGTTGQDYVICGFMVERIWEVVSVYINFENFLDARQTRFDTIYTGNVTNPTFRDIYAPLDGFVINGGIKIKL
jgi:outer membrane receptor for ferrienterochelin and colicins